MPTSSTEIREHVLDLLWSLWEELGVAGAVPRRHGHVFIDPEPLILFTALHGDLDPRLRDESIDWVIRYGSYVSKARMKNLAQSWSSRTDPRFLEYCATVNAHARLGWPEDGARALEFRPRGRALLEDLTRPSLISFRARAILGVGARSELIRVLLSRPDAALTATELAQEASYVRRNIVKSLEPLQLAGFVKSSRAGASTRFALSRAQDLKTILAPLPDRFPPWGAILFVLRLLLKLVQEARGRSELHNALAVRKILKEHRADFERAGLFPPVLPPGSKAWTTFERWAVEVAGRLARSKA